MSKLKLFVSYKTNHKLLKNSILTPIQTGRAIADEVFEDMIGDDTGNNISKENDRYCELTAQYWVWKNYEQIGNPNYVGFMHYRRQFIFDNELKHLPYRWLPKSQFWFVDHITKDYMKYFSEDKILPYLDDMPDCIVYKKVDIKPISHQTNMRLHFFMGGMPGQREDVFDTLDEILNQQFPEYKDTFNEFKNGHHLFCCNSFIMKKDLFFEYSDFLFAVLGKLDAAVDSSKFNRKEIRFLGFVGEYLMTVFLMKKLKDENFKIKELPGTFVSKDYIHWANKLKKYKIMSRITFGKKKKYYIKKYVDFKRRLQGN